MNESYVDRRRNAFYSDARMSEEEKRKAIKEYMAFRFPHLADPAFIDTDASVT